MPVTEVVHHPLVANSAQDRELYHKQYTMSGLQELQTLVYSDPSVSNSGAFFTIRPPVGNTLIDRNILLELTVRVKVPTGQAIGDRFAPKCMPANRMIDTCNLKINDQSILSEPGRYVGVLSQYKTNQEFIKKYRSLSPTEPDHFNRYENYDLMGSLEKLSPGGGTNPILLTDEALLAGNYIYGHNPQSPFRNGTQCTEDYEPRGAFPYTTGDDGTYAYRDYVFTEPLLNPFCMPRENTGVAHVRDLQCQINFTSNLDRAFSAIYSYTYTTATAADYETAYSQTNKRAAANGQGANISYVIKSAKLYVKVATASIPLSVKQDVNYNAFQIATMSLGVNNGTGNFSASGAVTGFTFNTMRLGCIPSHVFIFARPQPSNHTRFSADAFLAIDKISITCMNKTGILAGFTPQQLYNISVENGINMSWGQWSRRVGSILCLNIGKDIPQLLPGVLETLDFGFTIDMHDTTHYDNTGTKVAITPPTPVNRATNDQSITWELCMLTVTPCTLTVSEGMAVNTQGISPAEAQDAIDAGPSMETLNEVNQAIGGGFSDWMSRNSHKAWTGVKKYAGPVAQAANVLAATNPSLAPLAAGANMVSAAMGSGSHRRTRGGGLLLN